MCILTIDSGRKMCYNRMGCPFRGASACSVLGGTKYFIFLCIRRIRYLVKPNTLYCIVSYEIKYWDFKNTLYCIAFSFKNTLRCKVFLNAARCIVMQAAASRSKTLPSYPKYLILHDILHRKVSPAANKKQSENTSPCIVLVCYPIWYFYIFPCVDIFKFLFFSFKLFFQCR